MNYRQDKKRDGLERIDDLFISNGEAPVFSVVEVIRELLNKTSKHRREIHVDSTSGSKSMSDEQGERYGRE